MSSWGNAGETTQDQDMISGVVNKRILRVDDVNDGNDDKIALETINTSTDADARALKVEGKSELAGSVIVGDGDTAGNINSTGSQDLNVGTGSGTEDVSIGNVNKTTNINNQLRLGAALAPHVGGAVDAYDDDVDLYVGTDDDYTRNVIISRAGKTTQVKGALDVDQNANFDGSLHVDGNVDFDGTLQVDGNTELDGTLAVGPAAGAGQINAGGTPDPMDLEIGGEGGTKDVILSQDGQRTDILGDARLNGNELVVNDAANLTAATGCGLAYNAAGHAPQNTPSIDFYAGGAIIGWVDASGFIPAP